MQCFPLPPQPNFLQNLFFPVLLTSFAWALKGLAPVSFGTSPPCGRKSKQPLVKEKRGPGWQPQPSSHLVASTYFPAAHVSHASRVSSSSCVATTGCTWNSNGCPREPCPSCKTMSKRMHVWGGLLFSNRHLEGPPPPKLVSASGPLHSSFLCIE